jgi:hypothetical protein
LTLVLAAGFEELKAWQWLRESLTLAAAASEELKAWQ